MMTETIKKVDITKLADEIEKDSRLEMYWDYQDKLSEEQILKIITEEDVLMNVENEIYDYNLEYIGEIVNSAIDEKVRVDGLELSDEDRDELRMECESRFKFGIDGLIKNSQINLRLELSSNEDMIYISDIKNSDCFKEFKRVFRGKYKKEDLSREINNAQDYADFCFYFRVCGNDILVLREQVLSGQITLRKGLFFGLFDGYNGGGSVLEIELLKPVTLNLKDWRIRNEKEAIIMGLKDGSKKSYYNVVIKADNISKYGIQETYGLSSWQEF